MLDNECFSKKDAAGLSSLKWNRNIIPQGTIFLTKSNNNYKIGWRIIGTTTKTTYETTFTEPSRHNFLRVKAQKGELTSGASNIAVVNVGGVVQSVM